MRRRQQAIMVVRMVAALGVLAPAPAAAETIVTPFFGVTFGGDAPVRRPTLGAGVTLVGRSLGLELEAANTKKFFGDANPTSVTTLTAAVVGGADEPGTGVKSTFWLEPA
jgi:hypothetical protein